MFSVRSTSLVRPRAELELTAFQPHRIILILHLLMFLSMPSINWTCLDLLTSKMAQQEEILPACPIPRVVQPQGRIEWLEERLKEPKNERQRTNLLALIWMYKTGELGPLTPGRTIYICNGKILDKPISSENLPPPEFAIWAEVSVYLPCVSFLQRLSVQMMQQSHPQENIPK